jgi:hypothetical protein
MRNWLDIFGLCRSIRTSQRTSRHRQPFERASHFRRGSAQDAPATGVIPTFARPVIISDATFGSGRIALPSALSSRRQQLRLGSVDKPDQSWPSGHGNAPSSHGVARRWILCLGPGLRLSAGSVRAGVPAARGCRRSRMRLRACETVRCILIKRTPGLHDCHGFRRNPRALRRSK